MEVRRDLEGSEGTQPRSVDVAIIGAGPAGSTLAALLRLRRFSVALIDRDAFPRDKLCGEFLSYDALPIVEALGLTPALDSAGSPFIRHCRMVGRHRTLSFDLPHAARGVSRLLLDDLLHRRAIEAGALEIPATATTLSDDGVNTSAGPISASVVVGAWGRWGRFDTQLERGFVRDHSHRNFGFKRHYRAMESSSGGTPPETIDLHSFRGGYLGVNAVEGGLTNICGLVHARRLAGLRGKWDSFVETLRQEEPTLDRLYQASSPAQNGYLSSEPVIFRARSACESGILMVGDASGVIDPLTGNGMAMAMQSAVLAAGAIGQILDRASDRPKIEGTYRTDHAAMFGRRIAWSRAIGALLTRPALLNAALLSVRSSAVGSFLARRTRADRDTIARMVDAWMSGTGNPGHFE